MNRGLKILATELKKKKSQKLDVERKSRGKAVKLFLVERPQILLNRDVIFWLKILDSVPLPYIWHFKKDIPVKLVF